MRLRILACVVLFAAGMEAVRWGAYRIVGAFGLAGTIVTIGAIYVGAVVYERRQEREQIEILPPL